MSYTAHVDTFARDQLPPGGQWPELILQLPELQYPPLMNCATELLDKAVAAGHGDRPAIRAPGIDGAPAFATYRQGGGRGNQIAPLLKKDLKLPTRAPVLLRGA